DDRVLSTEFQGYALEAGGRFLRDHSAGRYRTDKADAAHVGMANQRGSDLAVTRDDIDDARGENSFTEFAETQARERRLFGALDHDAVAGGEWRCGLLGAKPKWMIERIDLRHHAERLAPRQVEMASALRGGLALDFGDEPGAIAQPVRRPRSEEHTSELQ